MYTVGRPVIMRPNGGGIYILSIYTQHVCANGPAFSSRQTLVSTLPSQEPSTKKKLNSHTPAMKRSLIDNILPPLFLLERKRFHSSSVFHSVNVFRREDYSSENYLLSPGHVRHISEMFSFLYTYGGAIRDAYFTRTGA